MYMSFGVIKLLKRLRNSGLNDIIRALMICKPQLPLSNLPEMSQTKVVSNICVNCIHVVYLLYLLYTFIATHVIAHCMHTYKPIVKCLNKLWIYSMLCCAIYHRLCGQESAVAGNGL